MTRRAKLESLLRASGCTQPMSVASAIEDLIREFIQEQPTAHVCLSDIQHEIDKLNRSEGATDTT